MDYPEARQETSAKCVVYAGGTIVVESNTIVDTNVVVARELIFDYLDNNL